MRQSPSRTQRRKTPVTVRTARRIIGLAYDMEALAARLREAGHESEASGVQDASSRMGNIGRGLERKLEGSE